MRARTAPAILNLCPADVPAYGTPPRPARHEAPMGAARTWPACGTRAAVCHAPSPVDASSANVGSTASSGIVTFERSSASERLSSDATNSESVTSL